MSWDELRTRGRQEVAKRWDVARYRLGLPLFPADRDGVSHQPMRFFFAPSEIPQLTAQLQERLPREADQIVEQADKIGQHRFDLLGYRDLEYGPKIDWHLDAVNGVRAPRQPWFQIPYLDFRVVGDVKVTWELNRHQHLVTLAKAYLLTGEERFVRELLRQWYHWQRENPYPIGVNWASSLEVAIRSLSWLWLRHLLGSCSAVPAAFPSDLRCALALHGRHIEKYLSTYFSPNTHLLGEGVGLFFLGTLCPGLPAARRWQQRGWEIVQREAERQVQPDGMHFEQSTYYHVYALDFLLHARVLAARNQIPLPAHLDPTIERMLELLYTLGRGGTVPRLGDDDGGRVFNPRRNRPEHLLDPLTTGAVLFGRADFKAVADGLREETLWLLGAEGAAQFDRILNAPRSSTSVHFESSGLYVMTSRESQHQQLVVDACPRGAGTAGHTHADALSLHLTVNGREWLIDPGTFTYVGQERERDFFRGTAAHNTVQVDDFDQAEPAGPFGWRSLPRVNVERWIAGETFDLFVGSHTGYGRLRDAVTHRRWVFHLHSHFWLVRDLAHGKGDHHLAVFWHFGPGSFTSQTAASSAVIWTPERQRLAVLPVKDHGWWRAISTGLWSPVYGELLPAPVLCFRTQAALPVEFSTLLLPLNRASQNVGVLERRDERTPDAAVRAYRYSTSTYCHELLFPKGGRPWAFGGWASDAEFVYVRTSPEGSLQHWILSQGSYLEFDGHPILACQRPVARCEWLRSGSTSRIFGSDPGALSFLRDVPLPERESVASGGVS